MSVVLMVKPSPTEIQKMLMWATVHYRGSFVQRDAEMWKRRIALLTELV